MLLPYDINQKWPQHHVVATTPCPSNFANAFFNALMLPTPDILPTKQQDAAALLCANWVTLASPLATPPQASTAVASPTAINPLSPLTVDSCAAAALAATYKKLKFCVLFALDFFTHHEYLIFAHDHPV